MRRVVKLRKIGNSLMITVPKELIEDLKWKENDELLLQSIPLTPDAYVGRPKYLKIDKEED